MMEAARAMGEALSKADLKLFGDPASAAAMVQNLSRGMGFRAMINGFMDDGVTANGNGNGHGANGHGSNGHASGGDGVSALMDGIRDAVMPILQRTTSTKEVDAGTVEAIVKAVLAAQSATNGSGTVAVTPPAEGTVTATVAANADGEKPSL